MFAFAPSRDVAGRQKSGDLNLPCVDWNQAYSTLSSTAQVLANYFEATLPAASVSCRGRCHR